jgi:hypothetical protein
MFGQETESIAMNAIRQVIVLLGHTILVTLAVAGGFMLGSAIGIPSWLQIVCLVPAGYLFIHLSGEPIPPMRRWVSYMVAIIGLVSVVSFANWIIRNQFPSIHQSTWISSLIFGALLFPMRAIASYVQRHWPFRDTDNSSETRTP